MSLRSDQPGMQSKFQDKVIYTIAKRLKKEMSG